VKQDPTVALVASDVEQSTKDYLLKTLTQNFKGHRFAHLVGDLLETMGYRTRVSPEGPDKGIDIVAFRDELGLHPPIIRVQVKSGEGNVGSPEVHALAGAIGDKGAGLFVTLALFSKQARDFAEAKGNLRLLDGDALPELLLEHYEELDAKYRAEIPLKRVYIPEPAEEAGRSELHRRVDNLPHPWRRPTCRVESMVSELRRP